DDSFDTDQGYRGKNQFWFAIQNESGDANSGDNGMEIDGDLDAALELLPASDWSVYNVTMIGRRLGTTGTEFEARAFRIRDDAQPKIYNGVFVNFQRGVRVETNTDDEVLAGQAVLGDIVWNNITTLNHGTTVATVATILPPNAASVSANPLLTGIAYDQSFGLDPRPQTGSPALAAYRSVPVDGFHTPVNYRGAFKDKNWLTDWTGLAALCVVDPTAGTSCKEYPALCVEVAYAAGNATVTWDSIVGRQYQVQVSTDMVNWANEGSVINGTGGVVSHVSAVPGVRKQFRVITL
ncbi:MAG: hypothetical protein ACKVYV_00500, partial [Limisphaerales bacterium]